MAKHHCRPFQPYRLALSGSVHPCTLPDASFCVAKTSLLRRTTDIRVRFESVHPCTLFPDILPCMSGKDEFYTKLASD